MPTEKCQASTKTGNPCRNNAVANGYCNTHKEQAVSEGTTKAESSTASFDAIVNAGAKLVDSLEKAINHTPKTMEKLFKYSGAQLMAPALSAKLQTQATEKTRSRLQKFQLDFINLGADPEKLDQLLAKTRKLEATVESTLAISQSFLPQSLREELKRSLASLRGLHK
jgi:mevalonate kinase